MQALGVGPDDAQRGFHFMGKTVHQLFALGQEKPLLFHILFKLYVCVLQTDKGLLQIFSQSVQTGGQLPKFIG